MTNLIANQKGAASTFYTVYAPDDVHEHDVDVTRWASRGVAEAVPLDSCTPLTTCNAAEGLLHPCWSLHYKTNRRITSRIIRLELVVRTIGLVVRTIRLIVRTISSPWDPGGW